MALLAAGRRLVRAVGPTLHHGGSRVVGVGAPPAAGGIFGWELVEFRGVGAERIHEANAHREARAAVEGDLRSG